MNQIELLLTALAVAALVALGLVLVGRRRDSSHEHDLQHDLH